MPSRRAPQPVFIPKKFTLEETSGAIVKMRRCIDKVQQLITDKVFEEDPRVRALESSVRSTIADVFTTDSLQWREHEWFSIDRTAKTVNISALHASRYGGFAFPGQQQVKTMTPDGERGYRAAIVDLEAMVLYIEEQRADHAATPVKHELSAHIGYAMHPRIAAVSAKLFHDGSYRNAVMDGFLALRDMVREKSGLTHLDGGPLMTEAFNKDGPLKMSDDRDEQQGAMFLYAGAAAAVRNPRVHNLDPDTADEGRELLGFLSFLARELATATRRVPQPATDPSKP